MAGRKIINKESDQPKNTSDRARLEGGPAAANYKTLSGLLGLKVAQRGHEVSLYGATPEVLAQGNKVLEGLRKLSARGEAPSAWDVEWLTALVLNNPEADLDDYIKSASVAGGLGQKSVTPKTVNQKLYIETMERHDLVFGLGPAGTGKTYLAVAQAVAALSRQDVSRLIITRPAVEAGERLGFLPGDLAEKINPYLRPLYDALGDLIPYDKYVKLAERRIIEVAPLAFMRGRTLSDAFVILDEAQNCTREQMKMFLTRLGPRSKAVVTGDTTQSDLPAGQSSGLNEAVAILKDIDDIGFCYFKGQDVIRHRLVKKIIAAYDQAAQSVDPKGFPRTQKP